MDVPESERFQWGERVVICGYAPMEGERGTVEKAYYRYRWLAKEHPHYVEDDKALILVKFGNPELGTKRCEHNILRRVVDPVADIASLADEVERPT